MRPNGAIGLPYLPIPFSERPITFIDDAGQAVPGTESSASPELLVELYRWMLLTRSVDERGGILVRQGRTGFYAQNSGQEAAEVGSAAHLGPNDWVFPAHRELGVVLMRGMTPGECFAQILSRELDPSKGRNLGGHFGKGAARIVGPSSTVGNQCAAALGVALSAQMQRKDVVVMTYFGDGATSEGDLLATLNMAGVYRAPIVFACQNNQFAISASQAQQTASRTFAEKARAFGFDGYYVDGNDVVAAAEVTGRCIERARNGGGPSFIEYVTYRLAAHSSADDDARYRTPGESATWRSKDPILRMRGYLRSRDLLSDALDARLAAEVAAETEAGLAQAEASPPPGPASIFDHTYAEPTWYQRRSRAELFPDLAMPGAGA